MTVILVLVTFLVFIVLDYVLNRRKVAVATPVLASAAHPNRGGADYVGPFLVPKDRSYHAGHSWLMPERKSVVRVGADEFAAALAGTVERIELPKPGQWIRQGQEVFGFYKDGEKVGMVAPTEGEVLAANTDLVRDPSLLRRDPYGAAWLITVNVPDEETTTRNLVPKCLITDWMRDAIDRLYAHQPVLAGAVAADGGRPAEDLTAGLPDANWKTLAAEFFLTA